MIAPRYLLWVDCCAAFLAGLVVFSLSGRLSELYALPQEFLRGVAAVNVAYGLFSCSLALRVQRPRAMIAALVLANATWGMLCWIAVVIVMGRASLLGVAHLAFEGLFVGWLAHMEWTQREALRRSLSWS
jgi:hypothetical protein